MIANRKVFCAALFLVSCTSAPDHGDIEASIGLCIDELAVHNSMHAVRDRLIERWSTVHVVQYSKGQVLHLFFKQTLASESPKQEELDGRRGIVCTLDGARRVISLASPEWRDNKEVIHEHVIDDQMIEDTAFEEIAGALRDGDTVYRHEAYYRLSGEHVEPVGAASKFKVLSQDFGVE